MGKTIKLGGISLLALFLIAVCLIMPTVTAHGARSGLILCGNIVIPSLFPFCVLALFCENSNVIQVISRLISKFTEKIFHLSGEQFSILILSVLGGFPVGIRLIKAQHSAGKLSPEQAKRMGLYCISAGPAFIVTAIGEGMLGNRRMGILLLISNVLATLFLCFIIERPHKPTVSKLTIKRVSISDAFVEATAGAAKTVFGICGWVVLFATITELINSVALPKKLLAPILYSLEVTTAAITAERNVLLICAILSFCGFCVHCQIYSIGKEIAPNYAKFLLFRVIHGAVSCTITYTVLRLNPKIVSTLSNHIAPIRNNVSFTYSSALALVILSVCLIFSINDRKNNKIV